MREKIVLSFGLLVYGFYILYFHEFIGPLGHGTDLGMFVLLASIPALCLFIPSWREPSNGFLIYGWWQVSLFLILATSALIGFTLYYRAVIDNHHLDLIHYYIIPIISIVACGLTSYYNVKANPKDNRLLLIIQTIGLYAFQLLYSLLVLLFLYVRVSM